MWTAAQSVSNERLYADNLYKGFHYFLYGEQGQYADEVVIRMFFPVDVLKMHQMLFATSYWLCDI